MTHPTDLEPTGPNAQSVDQLLDQPDMTPRALNRATWNSRPGSPMPDTLETAVQVIATLKADNRGLLADRDKYKRLYEMEQAHVRAMEGMK